MVLDLFVFFSLLCVGLFSNLGPFLYAFVNALKMTTMSVRCICFASMRLLFWLNLLCAWPESLTVIVEVLQTSSDSCCFSAKVDTKMRANSVHWCLWHNSILLWRCPSLPEGHSRSCWWNMPRCVLWCTSWVSTWHSVFSETHHTLIWFMKVWTIDHSVYIYIHQ